MSEYTRTESPKNPSSRNYKTAYRGLSTKFSYCELLNAHWIAVFERVVFYKTNIDDSSNFRSLNYKWRHLIVKVREGHLSNSLGNPYDGL